MRARWQALNMGPYSKLVLLLGPEQLQRVPPFEGEHSTRKSPPTQPRSSKHVSPPLEVMVLHLRGVTGLLGIMGRSPPPMHWL
jgi:hypothetical protein